MSQKKEILDENQNFVKFKEEPNLNSSVVIDLTSDEDLDVTPPVKKTVLNKSQEKELGESQETVYYFVDQPGPSWAQPVIRKSPRNTEKCVSCNLKHLGFVDLACRHRVCYDCLKNHVMKNKTVIDICPEANCNYEITDQEIKALLIPGDYISFLEHSRDVLRKALKLRDLEIDFLGAKEEEESSSAGSQAAWSHHPIIEKDDEVELIQDADTPAKRRRRSELVHLQNLYNESYNKNISVFECPICFDEIEPGNGVVLKNCLHNVCVRCFCEHVKMCEDPAVICPYNSKQGPCELFIQEREIRAIVPKEILEIHLSRDLKRAEATLDNIFHCKMPDCKGFIQYEVGRVAICCPVCNKINCIKCEAIHEVRKLFNRGCS